MSLAVGGFRQDIRVLGLIGSGHLMSHFYIVLLPPLFPLLKVEYGLSYTELGLIMTAFRGAAAAAQLPVGFLVDRMGARAILVVGLLLEACAIGAMAFSPDLYAILGLAVLAGLGHSVFHPADYAIMVSSVDHSRMGRAFSAHTFSGEAGTAIAPAFVIILAGIWSWKLALLTAAVIGIAIALSMLGQLHILADHLSEKRKEEKIAASGDGSADVANSLSTLLSPGILILFLFFLVTTVTTSGLVTFTVALLFELHGMPFEQAAMGLQGYLIAAAVGVIIGGWIADRTRRHALIAAIAFLFTAVALVVIGEWALNVILLVALFVAIGLLQGVVKPARDMMVQEITPKGTTGSVFAFMSMGRLAGGTLTPVLIGWMIDSGAADSVFWLLAAFMILGLATLYIPRKPVTAAANG